MLNASKQLNAHSQRRKEKQKTAQKNRNLWNSQKDCTKAFQLEVHM